MATVKNDLSVKFSLATRILHWVIAVLVFALIPLGIKMHELEVGAEKLSLYKTHSLIGVILLVLMLIRVYVFFKHERPPHLQTGSKWKDKLAVWIHNAFYFVILLMTFTGVGINAAAGLINAYKTNDVAQFPAKIDVLPAEIHKILFFVTGILILLHVGGFVKHLILKKENTLNRII